MLPRRIQRCGGRAASIERGILGLRDGRPRRVLGASIQCCVGRPASIERGIAGLGTGATSFEAQPTMRTNLPPASTVSYIACPPRSAEASPMALSGLGGVCGILSHLVDRSGRVGPPIRSVTVSTRLFLRLFFGN